MNGSCTNLVRADPHWRLRLLLALLGNNQSLDLGQSLRAAQWLERQGGQSRGQPRSTGQCREASLAASHCWNLPGGHLAIYILTADSASFAR